MIASSNAAREEEMTLLRRPAETELSPPSSPRHQVSMINSRNSTLRSVGLDHVPVKIKAPPKNAHHDANIESLIEKMKSGLEVCLISVPSTFVQRSNALRVRSSRCRSREFWLETGGPSSKRSVVHRSCGSLACSFSVFE